VAHCRLCFVIELESRRRRKEAIQGGVAEVEIYLIAKSQPKWAAADVFGLSVGLFFFGDSDSVLGCGSGPEKPDPCQKPEPDERPALLPASSSMQSSSVPRPQPKPSFPILARTCCGTMGKSPIPIHVPIPIPVSLYGHSGYVCP